MAINIIQGYNPSTTEPMDSRTVVASAAARYAIASFNAYEGLVVYQTDTNEVWILTDTANIGNSSGWTQIPTGGGGGAVTAAGTADINAGTTGDIYIRPAELEASKHTTINVFNYLNFT